MFIETDAKSKPAYYLKKMFATKDYENKAQGGLSFGRGSSVYVLLPNGNGWCNIRRRVILSEKIGSFLKRIRCVCNAHCVSQSKPKLRHYL